jgi:hypothetical protein
VNTASSFVGLISWPPLDSLVKSRMSMRARLLATLFSLACTTALSSLPPLRRITVVTHRHAAIHLLDDDNIGSSDDGRQPIDWDAAMSEYRQKTGSSNGSGSSNDGDGPAPTQSRNSDTPASTPTSFRFESSSGREGSKLPLDERDDQLLRLATIYGGRALTLITLGSLVFYIYIGLTVRRSAALSRQRTLPMNAPL